MLKLILKTLAWIGGGALLITFVLAYAYLNRGPSVTEVALESERALRNIQFYMAAGCTAGGGRDENFSLALFQSQGMVCLQVVGREMEKTAAGTGQCKADDGKCMFATAFLLTRMRALSEPIDTYEELRAIEEQIEDDFEKLTISKGNQ